MVSTTTSRSSAKTRILDMLKADHKKVKQAFKDFEKLDPQENSEDAEALVRQTLAELEVHATLEEQVFYPEARNAVKEEDLIDEAEVEHMTFKVLIGQLKDMSVDDEKFAATFKVLGEYVNHHVQEEEGEMFKALKGEDADWDSALERMRTQRAQLLEEQGLPPEPEEEQRASSGKQGESRSGTGASRPSARRDEARPQASSRSSKKSSSEK